MSDKYILEGHNPVPCNDLIEWAKWFGKADRKVERTDLPQGGYVSTVFIGLDHNCDGTRRELFETMVFCSGGYYDQDMERYATWEEAEAGHKRMVERITKR